MTVDNEGPTITGCPGTISATADADTLTATVNWVSPVATDPSGVQSFLPNYNPGSSFPVATTTVIYTARDTLDNIATCTFSVVVNAPTSVDNEGPTITGCPGTISVTADADTLTATVNWVPPVATDPSGVQSFLPNFLPGSLFPVATTTVIYTASDTLDNTATCTFSVIVNAPTSVSEGQGTVVVPVLVSLLSVFVIGFLVLALLLIVRKRRHAVKLERSKTKEDDPALHENPAYCSKDIPETPGTIMGVHVPASTSQAGDAERPSNTEGQTRGEKDDFNRYQILDEPAHHTYQGLTEMGREGSTATPEGTQATCDNHGNGLIGGKETGDYHLYQTVVHFLPTDGADYEEIQPNTEGPEKEFSSIN